MQELPSPCVARAAIHSDEFNAAELNSRKWHRKSPYWTNGRPPATFKAENVSIEKGKLRILNTRLNPTEGDDGKPGDKYSFAGGAVASKSDQAHYGYYDGKFLLTVNPSTSYNPQPFARVMYMHLVTETYDWEPGTPTDEDLADPDKNSTYYDWVRSYVLVRTSDIKKKNC